MPLKLGKLPARHDSRDLLFADYLTGTTPVKRPAQFGHENLLTTRHMYGNGPDDSVVKGFQGAGDCVFAAICNAITLLNASAGRTVSFTGKEAIAAYSEVTGYKIGDDSTDQGTDMRVALNWLKNTGIADVNGTRHKIGGYVALEMGNLDHFEQALYLGLVTMIGVNLPASAESQFNAGKPWSVVASHSLGGHCILGDALRKNFLFETWARDQQVTPGFVTKNMDEGYVIFSEEEILNGKDCDGIDFATLQADLKAL